MRKCKIWATDSYKVLPTKSAGCQDLPVAMTLAELMSHPAVADSVVDSPSVADYGLRVVRDVRHVTDGDVITPRAGDLLVLDDRAGAKRTSLLREVIGECQGAGVAGILAWGDLDAALLGGPIADLARENDVPLVLLADLDDAADVLPALRTAVRDAQLADARGVERVHEVFTRLSTADVSRSSPAEVLREVSRLTGCAAVLESHHHQVLAYDLGEADAAAVFANWEVRSSRATSPRRTFFAPGERWLVTTVGALGEDWGRLILLVDGAPTHIQTMVAERSAAVMALHRLAIRDIESIERHTHRILLTSVLSGQSDAELHRHLDSIGFRAAGGQLVGVAVQPVWPEATAPDFMSAASQQSTRDLADAVATTARAEGLSALVAAVDVDSVAVVLRLPRSAAVDTALERFARQVHEAAGGLQGSPNAVIVAAGTPVSHLDEMARSLHEALHVASAASTDPSTRDLYRLSDTHIRGFLELLKDDSRLPALVDRELGPILRGDDRSKPALLEVLSVFISANLNKLTTARKLGMSRPTLDARLREIERRLAVRLADAETVTSLHFALMAHRLLQSESSRTR